MEYNWGPHFIVPSESLKDYSGVVRLREELDDELLGKELAELGIGGNIARITNPWYYRRKGTQTWVKIGESDDRRENFPVSWNTTGLKDGKYEVLGLMHVFVKRDRTEQGIARQTVVEVNVRN